MRDCATSIVWTPPENLHLTLKFLGEIDDCAVPAVAGIVKNAAMCRHRLKICLTRSGVFPNSRNPRILWVGLGGQVIELAQMAAVLDQELSRFGFAPEMRPYQPHLTIGRFKSPVGAPDLIDRVAKHSFSPDPFKISEVLVMRSLLQPGGAKYVQMHSFNLCR